LALDAEALTRDLRKTAHSNAAETMLIVQQQRYVLNLTSVRDQRGRQRGTLMIARDVSDLLRRTEQIEHERARFSETVAQLEAEQRERALLAATVRNLTFPLIPVLPKVIVIPIIGEFSNEHVQDFVQILLGGIEREHATTAILDVTGVTMLDNAGAQGLATGVNSAHLLGARCILVGIRPEIAQALVVLGISLEQISTAPTLQAAVQQYLRLQRNPTALHNAHHQNALS
jgi:anti-anti-sigma regulatory factor